MTPKTTLIATALALTLAACGGNNPPATETAATAPTAEPAPAEPAPPSTMPAPASTAAMPAPAGTSAAPAPGATPAGDKPAAVVSDCATTIEANDAMQFNVGSIAVPASCGKFTITLKHVGTMPVAAMGHNVVIAKAADVQAIAADGMKAGAGAGYLAAGDARVVAHSKTIGGGETTSVSFDTARIKDGGPYEFFCSFPGHAAMMKGAISVG